MVKEKEEREGGRRERERMKERCLYNVEGLCVA